MIYQPLVSVYIVTCNRLHLLKRALDSVIRQTYTNFEVLVIDDCSDDDTWSYLRSCSVVDPRVKIARNGNRTGACYSRNRAINMASGIYITGLDDDDFFSPDRLEIFVTTAMDNQHFNVFFSDSCLVTNQGLRKSNRKGILKQSDLLINNEIGNQIFCNTNVLRKNLFDVEMQAFQDLECWYRILESYRALKIRGGISYIDVSHAHARIGLKKTSIIDQAAQYFIQKHSLSGYKKYRFLSLIHQSPNRRTNISTLVTLLLRSFSVKSSLILLKCYILK